MDTKSNSTPAWVAGATQYEQERAMVGRNWTRAGGIARRSKAALLASATLPIAGLALRAAEAPATWVNALGHAQGWIWTGCVGYAMIQMARIVGMEIQHHRALARAGKAIGDVDRATLVAAANDMEQDDFARLVIIKALRKESRQSLERDGQVSEEEFRRYRAELVRAYKEIDKRLDKQAVAADKANRATPFSTESEQRALGRVSLPRRAGL
jgi:hypothetical protein